MSGYPMLLTRKKADKELSASADSFSHTGSHSSQQPLSMCPHSWETAPHRGQENEGDCLGCFQEWMTKRSFSS